ncbi:MAG: S8 family serine peptidase, partial [Verrucomicrobiota bacterium]
MATALAKPIRLRNETFTPPTPDRAKPIQTHALEQPVTGLFLVQFAGVPTNDTLQQLRALNADILRSVPEDAFVVRLRGVRLSRVRGLPFIRWVGEYQPAWKVDSALLNRPAVAPPKAPELVRLKILAAPQAEPELAPLRAMFAAIPKQSATRFGTIIEGAIEPANLNRLAASDAVLWIERAPHPKLFDEVSTRIVAGEPEETEPGGTNGTFVHQLGYDGSGVTVAVADSGLHNGDDGTMHPDLEGRVSAFFHYGTLEDGSDEHGHGTHVSGIIAGNAALGERDETGLLYGLGVAPGAHIISQRIFDGIGNYEAPPSFEKLTRDAVRAGAYVGSNSWGDDTHGRYDLSAAEFDALVRDADAETPGDQPYVLEFSAGNAGPASHTIGSPAVAKNVIATGASQNNRVEFFIYTEGQETMADFSSRGPCEDGRIKPDVVAPGTWIASLQSGSATDENAWLTISPNYQYQGGTSQSGPHASGAAAVFIQYYRETFGGSTPSPALVKAALINSAVELDDPTDTLPSPNHDEGWGRIDLTEMVSELRTFEYLDQSVLLTTGQMYERRFLVGNGFDPLKITLVYTDVPGFPATLPALVNNLDLEIVAPDGQVYHGNQFVDGESTPNPTENDNINNVEGVHLARPLPGEYLLRIRARKVIEDSRRDTAAIDQDFALVISGDVPLPGTGLVTLDRRAYSAPATVQMKVIDYDLAGRPSVNVLIKSSTESGGEPLVLNSVDPRGIFSGAISTATGVASADGILQVRHDDTIEVSYIDAAPAETRLATARVDLMPPVISSVTSTNEFGQIVIRWETDELATSQVRFGANDVLDNLVASSRFVTFHEMTLAGLRVGTRYEFEVTSVDEAGNAATDNNRGQNYEFVPAPAATILLVDGFQDPLLEIPITGYTEALDRIGVSYEIWDLTVKEAPTAAQMKPFRVVLWRLPEFNQTPLTAAEQSALREYLEKGGAVFLASMELLSRLDSGGFQSFRKEVLQVEDFDEDVEVPTILGVEGDPIGSGIDLALDYTEYDIFGGFFGPDFSDTFMPSTNAVPILIEPGSGKPAGLRYPKTGKDSKGRLVFFSFPLEAVPDADPSPNNRHNLLLNVLRFLAPGLNGLSTLALDSPAYTIPSVVTVELADSDLVDRTEIEVKAFNFSSGEEQRIKLFSTATPGLFRGTFNLSGSASPPGSGTIQAGENDSVGVEYFDESVPAEIRASAIIDTRPPTISDVFAEA